MMYISLREKFHLRSCSVTLLIVTECVQLPPFCYILLACQGKKVMFHLLSKFRYRVEFKYHLFLLKSLVSRSSFAG
jgi:hypothetical protein